jgi:chemotaxis signal transduction protein
MKENALRSESGLRALLDSLPPELDAMLDERTRALGMAPAVETDHVGEREYLTFHRGALRLALPSSSVLRLYRAPKLTRIPCAPSLVARVMHVEGRIVSVLDLIECLSSASAAPTPESGVLLIEHGKIWLGLLVDRVHGLETILDSRITRSVDAEGVSTRVVVGTGPRMSIVLDPGALVMTTRSAAANE